jgi:hypothetical protein
MTREEKIEKRKKRSHTRKAKRIHKDKTYLNVANTWDMRSISWGRRRSNGSVFICEMRYPSCEDMGYCNGDC